jgi:SAM-dependent methyltransferase
MTAAAIARSCPVCGRDDAGERMLKGNLRLVQCRHCGMVYANPAPAAYATGEYYDDASGYYLSPAKLESDYSDVRFERELRLFRRFCARGKVLDVGCSTGGFLYQLEKRFPGQYERFGTDVSGAPLDYAESRGANVIRGDFLRHDFGAAAFDAITFWAVLEHLLQPKQFLEKARRLLAPAGTCFVLVPNFNSLATRLLGARYRYIYPQHLNYFTRRTLTSLAQGGFEVIDYRFTHFNPIVIAQDLRRGARDVSNAERGQLLQRTTKYKRMGALTPLKAAYRASEGFLGMLRLADNIAVVLRRTS